MFRRYFIVLCVLSLVLPSVGADAAVTYTFTTLNPAGTDASAEGMAMNLVNGVPLAAGVTGGGVSNMNQGYPVIFDSAGNGTDILSDLSGVFPTVDKGKVWAIDSTGDVVGNARTAPPTAPDYVSTQAAFFLASGSTSAVALPPLVSGDRWVVPYGIKDSLTVVGVDGSESNTTQAVIWNKTGPSWGISALPNLAGGLYSQANAINSAGIVAGWSNVFLNTEQYQDPVTWTNNGSGWVATDLITRVITGSDVQNATGEATALAVNSSGVAVGQSNLANFPSIIWHAVEFSGGNAVNLGDLGYGGSASDEAQGINDSGVIVGTSETTAGNMDAFIWDSVHGMRDMNTVFGPTGFNVIPTGWTLGDATGIDDRGDIVGWGTNSGGQSRGFLIRAWSPGDANGDGKVDINDLTIVLAHYGQTGMGWAQGEFTGDGTVDINDLTIVLANYGQSLGSSSAGRPPCPSPARVLLAFALLGLSAIAWSSRATGR